ncbi:ATP-binding cassette domain-containing protein [Myxococcota bacterium]|nr:ATP-binding cassette domain-containing protein [Myxococcota bacterium]
MGVAGAASRPQHPDKRPGTRHRSHHLKLPERDMRKLRGGELAMTFQEPMTSLNPIFRVGTQIGESLRLHRGMDRKAARREARRLMERVGIPDPEKRLDVFLRQFSGGMKQRVMIAMALAC